MNLKNYNMRDKNYRRREEAKHYKARIKILSNGNQKLLNADNENLSDKEKRNKNRLIHKIKTGDLKYGLMDKWHKKFSTKRRRLFQKTVDFKLPYNVFLKRQHVNPQVPGYNGDSFEDYICWLMHGDYNPKLGMFELDIYPDE